MLESNANLLPQFQVKQRANRRTRKASGGRTPKWRTARRGEGEREGEGKGLAARLADRRLEKMKEEVDTLSLLFATHSLTCFKRLSVH